MAEKGKDKLFLNPTPSMTIDEAIEYNVKTNRNTPLEYNMELQSLIIAKAMGKVCSSHPLVEKIFRTIGEGFQAVEHFVSNQASRLLPSNEKKQEQNVALHAQRIYE